MELLAGASLQGSGRYSAGKNKILEIFLFLLTLDCRWWLQAFHLDSIQPNKSSEKMKINKKRVATTFLINQCSKADSSHFVYLHEQTFFNNILHDGIAVKIMLGFPPKCIFLWLKKIDFEIKVRSKIYKKACINIRFLHTF